MKNKKLLIRNVLIGQFISLIILSITWSLTAQQVAKNTFPSVVLLVMEDENGQPISMGSGFFIKDNIVATNFHVVARAVDGYAKVVGKQTKYNISGIVGIDKNVDLILLSIETEKAQSLPLGKSAEVQIGDEIYAVGNPLGVKVKILPDSSLSRKKIIKQLLS